MQVNTNITLIGMPGVGKSTIGKKLAQKLGLKFLDIDNLVEETNGLKCQEIIERFDEEEFLKREEKTILSLQGISYTVIAPGGSCVYSEKSMDLFKKISLVIYLRSPYESLKKRITNLDTRGIVGLKKKGLEQLYRERVPLYEPYADITIDVHDNFNVDSVVAGIKALPESGVNSIFIRN